MSSSTSSGGKAPSTAPPPPTAADTTKTSKKNKTSSTSDEEGTVKSYCKEKLKALDKKIDEAAAELRDDIQSRNTATEAKVDEVESNTTKKFEEISKRHEQSSTTLRSEMDQKNAAFSEDLAKKFASKADLEQFGSQTKKYAREEIDKCDEQLRAFVDSRIKAAAELGEEKHRRVHHRSSLEADLGEISKDLKANTAEVPKAQRPKLGPLERMEQGVKNLASGGTEKEAGEWIEAATTKPSNSKTTAIAAKPPRDDNKYELRSATRTTPASLDEVPCRRTVGRTGWNGKDCCLVLCGGLLGVVLSTLLYGLAIKFAAGTVCDFGVPGSQYGFAACDAPSRSRCENWATGVNTSLGGGNTTASPLQHGNTTDHAAKTRPAANTTAQREDNPSVTPSKRKRKTSSKKPPVNMQRLAMQELKKQMYALARGLAGDDVGKLALVAAIENEFSAPRVEEVSTSEESEHRTPPKSTAGLQGSSSPGGEA
ncbi:unnamed protein product [Amoebophrya sp. A120]|nr:unnamed protein product [Amoebophrya sp. A120]|eukprot:GSA120T00025160001.1